jgi:hypothetical protein
MPLSKGYVRNAGTTPLDSRLMESARILSLASGAVRTGVLTAYGAYGDQTDIVVAGSGMAVNVKRADFVTSRSAADGAIIIANTGTTAVPIEAAPAANSRIDVVFVKHNDNAEGNGDTTADPVFGVVKGDAAASPTKKAVPTGAIEIATVTIPAGVTSISASGVAIKNTFRWTAPVGSMVNYRTVDEMQLDSGNAGPGQLAFIFLDSSIWERVTGAGWRVVYAPAFNRNFNRQYERDGLSASTTLGTITLPAMPFAFRAVVKIMGTGGGNSSAGGNFGIAMGISGTGVTASDGWNSREARYRPYFSLKEQATFAKMTRVDVPANTASTLTIAADSTVAISLSVLVDVDLYIAGEY